MKFIITGTAKITHQMAKDLLMNFFKPYNKILIVTWYMHGPCDEIMTVINTWDDMGFATHNMVKSDLYYEIENGSPLQGLIVAGAETEPDLVNYCIDNDIPVFDITRGMYPVTENL